MPVDLSTSPENTYNKSGALASAIEPLAKAGADLKVMMGYRHPTTGGKATIEVFPLLVGGSLQVTEYMGDFGWTSCAPGHGCR